MTQGTYISVKFSDKTNEALEKLRASLGIIGSNIEPKMEDFHSTIIYSKTPIEVEKFKVLTKTDSRLKIKLRLKCSIDIWDTNDSGRVLVLLLNSRIINTYHKISKHCGGTHGFDEYDQHISLAYDLPNDFKIIDPEKYKNLDFVLELTEFYFDTVDNNE